MGVHGNQMLPVSDGAQDVAHGIDFRFIESHPLQFFFDPLDNRLFLAAFAGQVDHVAQKSGHVGLVTLGQLLNLCRVYLCHGFKSS
jgi:hypothetical protein